jgi:hypothetical protein
VPLVGLAPLQPPVAEQFVALLADQFKVAAAPLLRLDGLAVKVTDGGASTVTVALDCAVPPAPLQLNVKVVVAVSAAVACVPLVGCVPLQPLDAVQLVALVLLQFRLAALPLTTLAGLAVNVTVGSALTVTVTLSCAVPPAPAQLNAKVVVAVSAPVDAVPLVGCTPLQPSDAVQLAALVLLQLNVDAPPLATLAGFALNATVGAAGFTVTVVLALVAPPMPVQLNI